MHSADCSEVRSCIACKYNLTGLSEYRCPECGRSFDPDDPKSFRIDGRTWRARSPKRSGFIYLFFAALGTICTFTPFVIDSHAQDTLLPLALVGPIFECLVAIVLATNILAFKKRYGVAIYFACFLVAGTVGVVGYFLWQMIFGGPWGC